MKIVVNPNIYLRYSMPEMGALLQIKNSVLSLIPKKGLLMSF